MIKSAGLNLQMALRDTLLKNIQHHMKRRSVGNMTELARLSGVPQPTLSKFETGVHDNISLEHIARIARALDIDPAQLFLTTADQLPVHRSEAFIGVMEQLTPDEERVVLATGDALIKSRKKAG